MSNIFRSCRYVENVVYRIIISSYSMCTSFDAETIQHCNAYDMVTMQDLFNGIS